MVLHRPFEPARPTGSYPASTAEVGLWEVISGIVSMVDGLRFITEVVGCGTTSGVFFGRLFGAHFVHKTLQMGYFCATERTLSDLKQMKRGVYEQGRKN